MSENARICERCSKSSAMCACRREDDPKIITCPAGHSETFKTGGGRKTCLAGSYTRVNNKGMVIETYDPNTLTVIYTCDVCGVKFERRWRNGKLLPDPMTAPACAYWSPEQLANAGIHLRPNIPTRPKTPPKPAERCHGVKDIYGRMR